MEPEVLTTTRYINLSWARWIQSTQSLPVSLRYILMLSFTYFSFSKAFRIALLNQMGTSFASLSGSPGA
jgi:hypothetical protein